MGPCCKIALPVKLLGPPPRDELWSLVGQALDRVVKLPPDENTFALSSFLVTVLAWRGTKRGDLLETAFQFTAGSVRVLLALANFSNSPAE